MLVKEEQLDLEFPRRWGGPQPGAGRPRGLRPRVLHRPRHSVSAHQPLHVTLRMRADVPKLRCGRFIRAFRQTLLGCSDRGGFRVVHYSIQHNHIHCLIEADDKEHLVDAKERLVEEVITSDNLRQGR